LIQVGQRLVDLDERHASHPRRSPDVGARGQIRGTPNHVDAAHGRDSVGQDEGSDREAALVLYVLDPGRVAPQESEREPALSWSSARKPSSTLETRPKAAPAIVRTWSVSGRILSGGSDGSS